MFKSINGTTFVKLTQCARYSRCVKYLESFKSSPKCQKSLIFTNNYQSSETRKDAFKNENIKKKIYIYIYNFFTLFIY